VTIDIKVAARRLRNAIALEPVHVQVFCCAQTQSPALGLVMPRQKGERNARIIRLLRGGENPSKIAGQFNLSPGRVTQIVAANAELDRLRSVLAKKYGTRPNIGKLADQTPIEVLILCEAGMHGWAVRVTSLRKAASPIRTIGTLRRMSDAELLRIPGIGTRMLRELRLFCPSNPGVKKT
jgi:hypothetical protein